MIKEELQKLGINKVGYWDKNKSYIIDLEDSDEWNKYDSIIEKSYYESLDEKSTITMNNANQVYQKDNVQLSLIADFDNDVYRLVAQEI